MVHDPARGAAPEGNPVSKREKTFWGARADMSGKCQMRGTTEGGEEPSTAKKYPKRFETKRQAMVPSRVKEERNAGKGLKVACSRNMKRERASPESGIKKDIWGGEGGGRGFETEPKQGTQFFYYGVGGVVKH